jgi:alpha-tubulin suppressor-like RCC1 family protein
LDAASGGGIACVWSLQVSADWNTLELVTQASAGVQTAIQTQIAWQAGESHCIALDFGQQGTALFLDGMLVAQGSGLPSIPCSVGELVIGSTCSGANPAGAAVDEFYSFNRFLTASDVAAYYGFTFAQAAKGPISGEEEAAWSQGGGGGLQMASMSSIRSPGNVYDPNNDSPCSPGGPFYITNVSATPLTNGTTTVSFDIQGGTNGVFYDIFATGNLNNSLADYQWDWIGQGMTCNGYTFSNQPAGQAFYVLELPAETMTVAFGDNTYGQINVPFGLSNAVAVAGGGYFSLALRNNGTVIAWGDNTYGQTNVPSGLTNIVGIAAGYYHGVALLANGSVTNWGWYFCPSNYFCSVTNRTMASAPPTSNVVAIAASDGQDLALLSNGSCVAWGFTNVYGTGAAYGTQVPSNLNLTNVAAIAAGAYNSLALRKNGTVEGWGAGAPYGDYVTNVPSGLSNVVAVATGGQAALALQGNGNVVAWGDDATVTNIPAGMAGVKAISAGLGHNLVVESGILNPVIFTQPTDQYALAGGTVKFTAEGEGVAGVQYQWQFNGVNVTDATNATLTLTNTSATNDGSYQVVITTDFGSITSSVATFTLVLPPQIVSTTPSGPGPTWINWATTMSVEATAAGQSKYPLGYQWQLNGTNIPGATSDSYATDYPMPSDDGTYTVSVINAAGYTNATLTHLVAMPGMVETWGSDASGECNRPAWLTNATAIAAGEYQSVAVTDTGTVVQWGQYSDGTNLYSVTNSSVTTAPPTSNVVAVAAGLGQALALTANGTVTAWGLDGAYGTVVPTNVTGVKAIACGWQFDVALLTNGTVKAWGLNTSNQTNVPSSLSNVTAIAAGPMHTLALQSNGTVVAWGYNPDGETNVPAGLTNVVAIAAGEWHNLALKADGTVVAWGLDNFGQTNVPAGLSNVMAVAAGDAHSVALKNDGTLIAWGENSTGQTNVPAGLTNIVITTDTNTLPPTIQTNIHPPIVVKLIAAGGNHTMAAIFSPQIQYPIDVSKDLLLVYNSTNISFSSNVCAYYMAHRPMVGNANVLGISCATNEVIQWSDYTNTFTAPIVNWLTANPTKRPQYVVLFQDLPSRVTNVLGTASIQYDMNIGYNTLFQTVDYLPTWNPYVTSINMNGAGGTNDCIAYINKLASMASTCSPGTLFISASKGGYGNTNWYFDYAENAQTPGLYAEQGVTNANPSASVFGSDWRTNIIFGTNVAGYYSGGTDGTHSPGMATNGEVTFFGNNGWYIMACTDSYDGQRSGGGQSGFLTWFAANAFAGTNFNCYNYSNTPVGAITYVNEPLGMQQNTSNYYGNWAAGKSSAISAWSGSLTLYGPCIQFQAVGDPFVTK